jgi:UDP-N-acetyl-D-galactosamine dehydrogenase
MNYMPMSSPDVVEKVSGLKFNEEFFAGYSPERINPGDKEHTVEKILKVTSGSTREIGKIVDDVYASVITAGTHLAPTIKIAEAAKVIENSQRDINIAFVNELAKIFNKMGIDTQDVLEAAGTKWTSFPLNRGWLVVIALVCIPITWPKRHNGMGIILRSFFPDVASMMAWASMWPIRW